MSDREQAVKDVADFTGEDVDQVRHAANGHSSEIRPEYAYAVSQRERVIQLERALRDCMNNFNMTRLIMPPDAAKQAAEIIAGYRDLLEGK